MSASRLVAVTAYSVVWLQYGRNPCWQHPVAVTLSVTLVHGCVAQSVCVLKCYGLSEVVMHVSQLLPLD